MQSTNNNNRQNEEPIISSIDFLNLTQNVGTKTASILYFIGLAGFVLLQIGLLFMIGTTDSINMSNDYSQQNGQLEIQMLTDKLNWEQEYYKLNQHDILATISKNHLKLEGKTRSNSFSKEILFKNTMQTNDNTACIHLQYKNDQSGMNIFSKVYDNFTIAVWKSMSNQEICKDSNQAGIYVELTKNKEVLNYLESCQTLGISLEKCMNKFKEICQNQKGIIVQKDNDVICTARGEEIEFFSHELTRNACENAGLNWESCINSYSEQCAMFQGKFYHQENEVYCIDASRATTLQIYELGNNQNDKDTCILNGGSYIPDQNVCLMMKSTSKQVREVILTSEICQKTNLNLALCEQKFNLECQNNGGVPTSQGGITKCRTYSFTRDNIFKEFSYDRLQFDPSICLDFGYTNQKDCLNDWMNDCKAMNGTYYSDGKGGASCEVTIYYTSDFCDQIGFDGETDCLSYFKQACQLGNGNYIEKGQKYLCAFNTLEIYSPNLKEMIGKLSMSKSNPTFESRQITFDRINSQMLKFEAKPCCDNNIGFIQENDISYQKWKVNCSQLGGLITNNTSNNTSYCTLKLWYNDEFCQELGYNKQNNDCLWAFEYACSQKNGSYYQTRNGIYCMIQSPMNEGLMSIRKQSLTELNQLLKIKADDMIQFSTSYCDIEEISSIDECQRSWLENCIIRGGKTLKDNNNNLYCSIIISYNDSTCMQLGFPGKGSDCLNSFQSGCQYVNGYFSAKDPQNIYCAFNNIESPSSNLNHIKNDIKPVFNVIAYDKLRYASEACSSNLTACNQTIIQDCIANDGEISIDAQGNQYCTLIMYYNLGFCRDLGYDSMNEDCQNDFDFICQFGEGIKSGTICTFINLIQLNSTRNLEIKSIMHTVLNDRLKFDSSYCKYLGYNDVNKCKNDWNKLCQTLGGQISVQNQVNYCSIIIYYNDTICKQLGFLIPGQACYNVFQLGCQYGYGKIINDGSSIYCIFQDIQSQIINMNPYQSMEIIQKINDKILFDPSLCIQKGYANIEECKSIWSNGCTSLGGVISNDNNQNMYCSMDLVYNDLLCQNLGFTGQSDDCLELFKGICNSGNGTFIQNKTMTTCSLQSKNQNDKKLQEMQYISSFTLTEITNAIYYDKLKFKPSLCPSGNNDECREKWKQECNDAGGQASDLEEKTYCSINVYYNDSTCQQLGINETSDVCLAAFKFGCSKSSGTFIMNDDEIYCQFDDITTNNDNNDTIINEYTENNNNIEHNLVDLGFYYDQSYNFNQNTCDKYNLETQECINIFETRCNQDGGKINLNQNNIACQMKEITKFDVSYCTPLELDIENCREVFINGCLNLGGKILNDENGMTCITAMVSPIENRIGFIYQSESHIKPNFFESRVFNLSENKCNYYNLTIEDCKAILISYCLSVNGELSEDQTSCSITNTYYFNPNDQQAGCQAVYQTSSITDCYQKFSSSCQMQGGTPSTSRNQWACNILSPSIISLERVNLNQYIDYFDPNKECQYGQDLRLCMNHWFTNCLHHGGKYVPDHFKPYCVYPKKSNELVYDMLYLDPSACATESCISSWMNNCLVNGGQYRADSNGLYCTLERANTQNTIQNSERVYYTKSSCTNMDNDQCFYNWINENINKGYIPTLDVVGWYASKTQEPNTISTINAWSDEGCSNLQNINTCFNEWASNCYNQNGDINVMGKIYLCQMNAQKNSMVMPYIAEEISFKEYNKMKDIILSSDTIVCSYNPETNDQYCITDFINTCKFMGGSYTNYQGSQISCHSSIITELNTDFCMKFGYTQLQCENQYNQYCLNHGGQLTTSKNSFIQCKIDIKSLEKQFNELNEMIVAFGQANKFIEKTSLCSNNQNHCNMYFETLCTENHGNIYSFNNKEYCSFQAEKVINEAFEKLYPLHEFNQLSKQQIAYMSIIMENQQTLNIDQSLCITYNGYYIQEQGNSSCVALSRNLDQIDISFSIDDCIVSGSTRMKCQTVLKNLCDEKGGIFKVGESYSCTVPQAINEICALVQPANGNNDIQIIGGCYNDQYTKYESIPILQENRDQIVANLVLKTLNDPETMTLNAYYSPGYYKPDNHETYNHKGLYIAMTGIGLLMILCSSYYAFRIKRNNVKTNMIELPPYQR